MNRSVNHHKRLALAVTSHLSVNRLLRPQLAGLRGDGWELHIICSPGPIDPEVSELAEVEFVPMERSVSPTRDAVSTVRMGSLLRKIRPDVLVGGTPKAALVSMLAGRLARVPVRVFQARGARWDGLEGRLRKVLVTADRATSFNSTDVVAVSNSLADLMVVSGACPERPIVLGSGGSKGVDATIFHPDPEREYDPATARLGFVGRLAVDKGINDALRVFDSIRSRIPRASMRVIGDLDESQPVSEGVINKLTGDPAITWERSLPQSAVAERMREMDILIFPSIREGLPNAVIEAAACGVPTVGWDAIGVRDAVVQGETGFLVPVGDQEALTRAIADALTPAQHQKLREGSVRFARSEFAAEKIQANFEDYLDLLLAESRR
jgi:glycosyltransferase involved in cell wall biosynthesis